jgi:mono/diheme cytochrome c family protein
MKQNIFIIIGAALVTSLSSCWMKSGGNDTGYEYAPDMYYSKGYEPMSQFSDSSKYRYNPYFMTMREPVKGSVAIGQLDYQYPFDNTPEGYEAAGASLQMPGLTLNEQIEGERLFGIYCAVCHGEKGGNDGTVASKQASMKPSWANYQDKYVKELPVGKIYHTITYGKNNMGSYASAVTPKDRWAIIAYVKRLSMMDSLGNMPKAVYIESAPVAAAVVADTTKKPEQSTPANSSSSTSNHSNHNKH